ncbi:hypothetical protein Tco_0363540 [Tanacetum coccineum]
MTTLPYALTVNPKIYTSCIQQFWATTKVKTVNGEVQLQALVDGKKVIITETSVRRDLQLEDAEGIACLPNADIFEQLALMGAKSTAWNEFSSTMASTIICLATNQKFNFSKYIFESMVKNVNSSVKFLMYQRNMKREGKGFSGRVTPLFPTMMVQAQEEIGEGSANPTDPHHTPIITQPSTSKPQKKQKPRKPKRKDTEIPQSSGPTEPIADEAANEENVPTHSNDPLLSGEDSLKLNDLMEIYTKLQQRVLDLENTKTAQTQEISSLKLRVKRLEKKGGSRTHKLKRLFKVGRSAQVGSSEDEGSVWMHPRFGDGVVILAFVFHFSLSASFVKGCVWMHPQRDVTHTILQCLSAKSTVWNEFSSTMASAIICLATNQKFNFSKYIFESMLKNVDSSVKFLMYPRFVQVFLNQQAGDMSNHKRIYVTPSHTKKIFGNMKREGKGFSRRVTPLFPTMMVQAQEEMGEGSANPTDPHHTPIITQPLTSKPQKKQKPRKTKRKDTEIPQSSGPTKPIADEAANAENVPTHSNDPLLSGKEISSLKLRVKRLEKKGGARTHKLKILFNIGRSVQVVSSKDEGLSDKEDASKQERKIDDIDKDAEVTLVDETQGRYGDDLVFDITILDGEEVFAGQDVVEKEVSTADPVTTAGEVVTTASVEVSAATTTTTTVITESTTIIAPSTIPKAKSITFRDPCESTRRTTLTPIPSNIKDKGKAKMIEPKKPLKKTEQIRLDEELAFKLQAEEEEQARLAREKDEKVEEANISWDNVKAMIEADRTLGEEKEKLYSIKSSRKEEQATNYSTIEKYNVNLSKTHGWLQAKSIEEQKLVKAKHGNTRPEEGYERVLWGDLRTMFEHHVEDLIWRNSQGNKLLIWRLYDSCGVHFVRFKDMHVYMLVEKRYPRTPATITGMLNKKLKSNYWNEMCYQLLKLMRKQLKKQ